MPHSFPWFQTELSSPCQAVSAPPMAHLDTALWESGPVLPWSTTTLFTQGEAQGFQCYSNAFPHLSKPLVFLTFLPSPVHRPPMHQPTFICFFQMTCCMSAMFSVTSTATCSPEQLSRAVPATADTEGGGSPWKKHLGRNWLTEASDCPEQGQFKAVLNSSSWAAVFTCISSNSLLFLATAQW